MKALTLITALTVTLAFTSLSHAQTGIEWQKCFGGSSSETPHSMKQTADGSFIMAGRSLSSDGDVTGYYGNGIEDFWVVQIQNNGNIKWGSCYGGGNLDQAYGVQQASDGGFFVAGVSSSNNGDVSGNHGNEDYWVLKLDSSGSIVWQRSLGGSRMDYAFAVDSTNDGGCIVAGSSSSVDGDVTAHHGTYEYADVWVVKLDVSGVLQWEKSLGGSNHDEAKSVQQTADGGYIIAGASCSTDGDVTGYHNAPFTGDYWVVKLDQSGMIQWEKSLGGYGDDQAKSIQQTTDKGYIVTGWSRSVNGDVTGHIAGYDYWTVKLDSMGTMQWQKIVGGSYDDCANSVQQTNDGGYIVTGYSLSNNFDVSGNHGGVDCWVVKLDSTGAIQMRKCLGGSGDDEGNAVLQTLDGEYAVLVATRSTDWDVTGNHGENDFWFVKLSQVFTISEINGEDAISVFPNPASGSITVKTDASLHNSGYTFYNNLGQVVLKGWIASEITTIDLEACPRGLYLLILDNNPGLGVKVIKD